MLLFLNYHQGPLSDKKVFVDVDFESMQLMQARNRNREAAKTMTTLREPATVMNSSTQLDKRFYELLGDFITNVEGKDVNNKLADETEMDVFTK